ncbi:MAG: FGLLP motif-containing membrane protein [Acidimicrobiales bacterium]
MRNSLTVLAGLLIAVIGVVSLSGVAFASTSPSPLLRNGDFGVPVVGSGSFELFSTGQTFDHWKVIGAPGNVGIVSGTFSQAGFSFPAESGKQWLDLTGESNSATGVSQFVPTVPGSTYLVSFGVGNVYDPQGIFGVTSTVDLLVNGHRVRSATNRRRGTTQVWQRFEAHFTATSKRTDVAFLNGDPPSDTNNGLDDIDVTIPTGAVCNNGGSCKSQQTSDVASYVPTPAQVSWSLHNIAYSWFWVAVLIVLLGAASTLFNATLDANIVEIQGWFAPLRRRFRRKGIPDSDEPKEPTKWTGWRGITLYLLIGGLVYTLRSPSVGTFADFAVGIAAGSIVGMEVTRRNIVKRKSKVGQPIALPSTLIVAAAFLAISALASARPGYVFGIVIGMAFTPALEQVEKGAYAAFETALALGVGIAAWLIRWPLAYGLTAHPSVFHRFIADVLAVIFVSSICTVAFGMVPLRFLPGEEVRAWNKIGWAVLWAVGLFGLIHILESGYGYASASSERTPTLVLGIALLVVAIAFWAYFRLKDGAGAHEEPAPVAQQPASSEPMSAKPDDGVSPEA